ncbi:DUF4163 domain-containing protein [Sphingomonas sp. IW22]|uniref:DUF4163 domain-containing protein n=1 Tax=Sphingomonas sp. IW22 TaxID=3242489 RepID=UPI003521D872
MRTVAILGLSAMLAACGDPTASPEEAVANTTAAPPAPAPAPSPPPAAPSRVKLETDDYSFAYAYPAEAAAIAPLARALDAERETALAGLKRDTGEWRRETEKGGFPYRPYALNIEWKVVTETPRLLSLSAETYAYTGGAHGSPGFDALLWDKAAGKRLAPTELFASAQAIQSAMGDAFCQRLDRARQGRRGVPVGRSDDPFNDCPKVAETTLILGSSDGERIDRVGLLVGPYVAGPYAEGTYDLTLPVTPAIVAAVRPEWREAFAPR